jgi:protein TonB
VLPKYTTEALERKIQGTVVLEVVVGREGIPIAVRVARSLDPGLDAEAVTAVREWRFMPGRLGSTPVDVLVTIWVDFRVV